MYNVVMESGKGPKNKRIMTPAIDGMTVKQERACLSEIRANAMDVTADYILENGWTAGDFSLQYIMGHQNKRKSKNSKHKSESEEGNNSE